MTRYLEVVVLSGVEVRVLSRAPFFLDQSLSWIWALPTKSSSSPAAPRASGPRGSIFAAEGAKVVITGRSPLRASRWPKKPTASSSKPNSPTNLPAAAWSRKRWPPTTALMSSSTMPAIMTVKIWRAPRKNSWIRFRIFHTCIHLPTSAARNLSATGAPSSTSAPRSPPLVGPNLRVRRRQGAMNALTREWAIAFADNVRVNCVPAECITPQYQTWFDSLNDPPALRRH